MKFAIIDTESNGLFRYKDANGNPVPADDPGQPRLAALAMILLNEDFTVQERYAALVKPDGWKMEPEAAAVNGLTDEILLAQGKPVVEVLEVYSQAVKEGFAIVAFNAQHDCKTMRGELRRAGMPDLFEDTPNVCVMRKAQGVIPRPDGKKSWPKLEHCREFLKISSDGAHTAGADAESALAVFNYLRSQGVDLVPSVHYAKPGTVNSSATVGGGGSGVGGNGGSGTELAVCTYPRCKCIVSTSTSQPLPICPKTGVEAPALVHVARGRPALASDPTLPLDKQEIPI